MTESQLTLFAVDSPAKTSASPENNKASVRTQGQDYGRSAPVYLGSFDLNTPSLRTSQTCLLEMGESGLSEYYGTFPRSGTMRSGTVYQLPSLAQTTTEIGSGLLPTPSARDHKGARKLETLSLKGRGSTNSLPDHFAAFGKTMHISPPFLENHMGYPTGWTELKHSETP